MPEITIDNGSVRLHYKDEGTAPDVILFLHGFPFNSDLWRPQLRALPNGYRGIAPDLRGFGATDPPPGRYSMARLADDVAQLLDALDVGAAVVVGLSMGGYVAFEVYRRHRDRVRALVLADTKPEPDDLEARASRAAMARLVHSEGSRAVAAQMLPKLLAPGTRAGKPGVTSELAQMIGSARPDAVEAALLAMADRRDSRPLLAEIVVPVLVVGGAEDPLTPPGPSRAWAAMIRDVRVEFIAGAGHVPNLERPEEFNALLTDFLAELDSASSTSPHREEAV